MRRSWRTEPCNEKWIQRVNPFVPEIISHRAAASYQGYCYEMKVIQAFSWMCFVLTVIALIVLMQVVAQAQMYGRYNIWLEPIRGQILFTGSSLALNHA